MDRTTYAVIPLTHSHLHTVEHRAHNDACLVAVEEMVTVSAHQQAGKKLLFLDDTAGDEHSVAVEEEEDVDDLRVLLAAGQHETVAPHAARHGDHVKVLEGTTQDGGQNWL